MKPDLEMTAVFAFHNTTDMTGQKVWIILIEQDYKDSNERLTFEHFDIDIYYIPTLNTADFTPLLYYQICPDIFYY